MDNKCIKKANLDWGNLPFGYVKTDYNIRFFYKDGAWSNGELFSDDTINLNIAAPCLHYGQEAFEGMKAFETKEGKVVIFRPEENANRLKQSCERLYMPEIPNDTFLAGVKKLISANLSFVPPFGQGASLYIRPVMIGVGAKVGLGPAQEYVLIIFATPVGPYYKGGFTPVDALIVEEFDRAAPQGVGDVKVGGNYAAGLRGSEFGHDKGFSVVLYLDPKEKKYIDEFSTSNFIAIKGNTYITPKSESILPSITNKSLMQLAENMGMKIERRPVHVDELAELDEVGAVGTAAVITPVNNITYRNKVLTFGAGKSAGPKLTALYENYVALQTGQAKDIFGWLTDL